MMDSEDLLSTLSVLISQIESLESLAPISMKNMEDGRVEKIQSENKSKFTFINFMISTQFISINLVLE